MGGLLHDLGKVCIPKEILNKPTGLSIEERKVIDAHARVGREMLKNIVVPLEVLNIVEKHHSSIKNIEKPIILKDISKVYVETYSIICAVADITDAVISRRPYKNCLSPIISRNDLYHFGILDIDEIYKSIGIFDENYQPTIYFHKRKIYKLS